MRITYITAGAAGTICGNCLRDNALAAALKKVGHDVVLLPAYTPLLTDEEDVSERRVVFSGVNLYLQSKLKLARSIGLLDPLLDHPRLLRWASSFAVDTNPAQLGEMTRDTFLGDRGPYRREIRKLLGVLRDFQPDVVHLTNSMLASVAAPIKRHLGVPVVCSLQGEADFLAGLPEPRRSECYDLLREHAAQVDSWIAPCRDQIEAMRAALGVASEQFETILPGISIDGYGPARTRSENRFVVGFLARISEEKGLGVLAHAVDILRKRHPERTIELRVAGWRADTKQAYIDGLQKRYDFDDLGYLERDEKIAFLTGLDAFSVPTTYRASKGLYVLEALAAGVPVVQPRIGVFPELLDMTGGGLSCTPGDSDDLAAKLETLMTDAASASRLGHMGRGKLHTHGTAERMAGQTLAVYEQLLG